MRKPLYDFFKKGKNRIRLICPLHGETIMEGHISSETDKAISVYEVDREIGELRSKWIPKKWFTKSNEPDAISEVNLGDRTIKVVDAILNSPWHSNQIKTTMEIKTFPSNTPINRNHTTPNNKIGTNENKQPRKNQRPNPFANR